MNFDNLTYPEAAQVYRDLVAHEQKGYWDAYTEDKIPQWVKELAQQSGIFTGSATIFLIAWRKVATAFAKHLQELSLMG